MAVDAISPLTHPELYPPVVAAVATDPSTLSQHSEEVDQVIKEGNAHHLEEVIFNVTQVRFGCVC